MSDLLNIQQLTDGEFEYFQKTVYRESGIKLTELKKALVQSRLMRRLRSLNLSSFTEYAEYLKENYSDEIINFINVITTNKTDFFRENRHFEFLTTNVFPELAKKNDKKIRIWSAGCSTGEEPYTIAITAFEYFGIKSGYDIKILATDIDTNVLEHAVKGVYKQETVSVMENELLKKYFLKGKNENEGYFQVKNFLKEIIVFKKLNLLDLEYPMKGKMDIIFCRNVIIYFDKETQRGLFNRLYRYLSDDGYLFIGHSENLTGLSLNFKNIGQTIYQKSETSKN